MKITRKVYQEMYAERGQLKRDIQKADDEERFDTWRELKAKLPTLEEFFEKLPKVKVEFSIGSRGYYREVVKIGKTYFQHGEAMTKGRGYWSVTEIAEITQQMKDDMMSDSYYY
tara:strand:- start:4835 stop:5176 length:342 start_codon:yes stop_codon:yes gene_type:complete